MTDETDDDPGFDDPIAQYVTRARALCSCVGCSVDRNQWELAAVAPTACLAPTLLKRMLEGLTDQDIAVESPPNAPSLQPQFALCFVRDGGAYFTSQPLAMQWGEGWDEEAYEHNAGCPFSGEGWTVLEYRFDSAGLIEPCTGLANSPWSVEDINSGAVPWLHTGSTHDGLFAGASPSFFEAWLADRGRTCRRLVGS